MQNLAKLSAPILSLSFVAGLVLWAYPEGAAPARQIGIILGWVGCGMLLASLFLALREPRLTNLLGGVENMYWWHHRLGLAAYVALLAHPLLLAGASLPKAPQEAWELLSPFTESWPVWMGWLSLLLLMAGLGATFATRLPYRIRRPLHAGLGIATSVGLIHLLLLGIDEPVEPLLLASLALLAWRFIREDWGVGASPYVVQSISRVSPNVVEISLAPLGEPLAAKPGQFVLVAFQSGRRFKGCCEFHPFTVSSIDGASGLRVAVKALGDCTRNIQSIEPGVPARVQGAFGEFLGNPASTPQYWIAGGIGITPFLALLRAGRLDRPTTLIYLYRSEGDALFVDELNAIAANLPNLALRLRATGDEPIDPESVLPPGEDVAKAEFWLCGPPPMIELLAGFLRRRGLTNRWMHFENFGAL
ncbi:ferric reductase-like transmembrane domain-containing protein [uncultured Rhodoblastus sp.]|uniref:ferric reductase-like transmembrane domain-containing protein n=1 Tax=uncultured Rhodoblastus sp. TaxID=543037 RepID=UPI0025FF2BBA|nr:ferric reductase-like transmembrane domain-containing protein [uncultured Rhodoblastus sp.]